MTPTALTRRRRIRSERRRRRVTAWEAHFLRSWTTDEASSGTEDSSSQKVSPGWGSSYRHPPRAEMPSGPVPRGCERPLEKRRTSGGKELRPVAPLAFGVRAFSALPRHFLRSWTTDEASSGTEDSSSQKV